jgi:hypothetical protein
MLSTHRKSGGGVSRWLTSNGKQAVSKKILFALSIQMYSRSSSKFNQEYKEHKLLYNKLTGKHLSFWRGYHTKLITYRPQCWLLVEVKTFQRFCSTGFSLLAAFFKQGF